MIINHNMNAMNAHRNMMGNTAAAGKSMEKLSSGLRINKAGDDAAGLAISEKMRGQIRGLDQASRNGQDGISMIQTAEGALGETHNILQRMRELAVQSSNDSNVAVDRNEIQKEMDELAKEITRISNNTEFNTQKLINGGIKSDGIGEAKFHIGANASQDITLSINAMDAKSLGVSRDVSTATLDATNAAKVNTAKVDSTDVTKTLAAGDYTVKVAATTAGATSSTSTGSVTVDPTAVSGTATADTNVVLTRTAGAAATAATQTADADLGGSVAFDTATKINIGGTDVTLTNVKALGAGYDAATNIDDVVTALQADIDATALSGDYTVGKSGSKLTLTSTATGVAAEIDLSSSDVGTGATLLGFTTLTAVNGSDAGADTWVATGDKTGTIADGATTLLANGVSVDTTKLTGAAVGDTVTISGTKDAGSSVQLFDAAGTTAIGSAVNISVTNGGNYTIGNTTTGQAKVNFKAGEATNGSSTITVATTAATTAVKESDDAMSVATTSGGINVSTQSAASSAITKIQTAIETVSAERSKLGAYQNRLEHTIANLGTASENLTSAESRIRDVDMAKEMMQFSKNNILSQAAQAMISQANQQPQGVLQLLR